jgi:capsular polysaccharide export protein
LGIYYDPTRPSRLEALIAERATLRPDQRLRAERLVRQIIKLGLSKYNLAGTLPELPEGERILVVGQVEDDASIRLGAGEIRTNADLIATARTAHPEACLIYKPHPDVEAGLRPGALPDDGLADIVARACDIHALLDKVGRVWTMTSLTGFEALLRGVPVTTLGAPFFAGWGLTEDRGNVPERRRAQVDLAGLVHAALIDYPRYIDPKTDSPCPVEVAVERLASGEIPHPGPINRALSKLQGAFASKAYLWRRDF